MLNCIPAFWDGDPETRTVADLSFNHEFYSLSYQAVATSWDNRGIFLNYIRVIGGLFGNLPQPEFRAI